MYKYIICIHLSSSVQEIELVIVSWPAKSLITFQFLYFFSFTDINTYSQANATIATKSKSAIILNGSKLFSAIF